MKTTRVYKETMEAYVNDYRYIINKGGTRSSKTYSTLQAFHSIASLTEKQRLITVVSHSLPHLEGGAIRDFDNILIGENFNIDLVKTKRPYIYHIGNVIVEFVGYDKIGKALGGTRDILFINEANHMPFNICHHLMQRTREAVFIDYNPSAEFWIDNEGYLDLPDTKLIHSSFNDNAKNLNKHIINDLLNAKTRHDAELQNGDKGYWWNWWRVYGLGLEGKLEGLVFQNWSETDTHPQDTEETVYGIDFGFAEGKSAFVRVSIYNEKLWVEELIYSKELTNQSLARRCKEFITGEDFVLADSAEPKSIHEMRLMGLNVAGATKGQDSIRSGIKLLQEYPIMVKGKNLIWELKNYIWGTNSKGEGTGKPRKQNDHLIDAMRYAGSYIIKRNMYEFA